MGLPIAARYEKAVGAYKLKYLENKSLREIGDYYGVSAPTAGKLVREGQAIMAKEAQATDLVQEIRDRLNQHSAWLWNAMHDPKASHYARGKFSEQYNRTIETYGKLATSLAAGEDSRKGRLYLDDEADLGNLRFVVIALLTKLLEMANGHIPPDTDPFDLIREAYQEEAEVRESEREFLESGDKDAKEIKHDMDVVRFPSVDPKADIGRLDELEKAVKSDD
jgi:hypothetical protein